MNYRLTGSSDPLYLSDIAELPFKNYIMGEILIFTALCFIAAVISIGFKRIIEILEDKKGPN